MEMNIAVIFAGGVGNRMDNKMPKQFLEVNGKAVIIYTLEAFERQDSIDGIVVICVEKWIPYMCDLLVNAGLRKVISVIPGGKTALDSQYLGLLEIRTRFAAEDVIVLIHDGVRPLIDGETIQNCLESVNRYGNAVTVVGATETMITIDDRECITNVIDRDICYMAKAPQCFRLDDILEVHEQAIRDGRHNFIDSASMMKAYGHTLHIVMGKQENIKITTLADYYMFLGILQSEGENR